ncbi:hypothetical protein AJ78_04457 [Emergomyces pasteurianus Ep9510]|uniref:Uncharacterized protein n=1 Tax=Emergomyces pasteurianus Ep9510 TaxID=1447872 RepID=A0A1J9PFQ8_9EURO|nr:hypothetical protein AJ78_04457 [Emergomyces pasteurianus Ep9510]
MWTSDNQLVIEVERRADLQPGRMLEIMLITRLRNTISSTPVSLSSLAEHRSSNCLTPAQSGHGCKKRAQEARIVKEKE